MVTRRVSFELFRCRLPGAGDGAILYLVRAAALTPDGGGATVPGVRASLRFAIVTLAAVVTLGGPASAAAGDASAGEPLPAERRIRWSPGIPGGIPQVTRTCATVDAVRYGNGITDATAAIQRALDACPPGKAVVLPAGTYRTTGVIWIRKGVVLRGAGPSATRIRREGAGDNWGGAVLRMHNDASLGAGIAITADAARGSTRIAVADPGPLRAGDIVLVDQRDDPARVVTGGCTWFKRMDPDGVARSEGQRVEIAAVSGKAVTLASPLYADLSRALRPEIVPIRPAPIRRAGIEDLYVTGGVQTMIDVGSAAYSWIRNVESEGVWGRHISLSGCYRCVVRDSYIHHGSHGYASGGNAYGISLNAQTSETLIENNVVFHLNKLVTFEASGGGNVVAYNYVDDPVLGQMLHWQEVAIDGSHCSFPHAELIEGNWAPHMGAAGTHGNAGGLTFFRNYASSQARTLVHTSNTEAVQLDAGMYDMNLVGNVLSKPGVGAVYEPTPDPKNPRVYAWRTLNWPPPKVYLLGGWAWGDSPQNFDPRVAATILRHGNFDYATGAVQWAPGLGRELPASLYLSEKPAFFGDDPWPWVDPGGATKVLTLPAKQRFDRLHAAP